MNTAFINNPEPKNRPFIPDPETETAAGNTPVFAPEQEDLHSAPSPRESAPLTTEFESPRADTVIEQTENIPDQAGLDVAIDSATQKLRQPPTKPTAIPQVRDELTMQVEQIMSRGLDGAYRALSPGEQQQFKIKGERTALEIRQLIGQARVKIKHILKLLLAWLRLLPGINAFFLEQEAKIKADQIMSLKRLNDNK